MTDAQRLSGEQSSRSLSRHSMDSIKKQADDANNTHNSNNNNNSNNNENNDDSNENRNESSNDNNNNNINNESNVNDNENENANENDNDNNSNDNNNNESANNKNNRKNDNQNDNDISGQNNENNDKNKNSNNNNNSNENETNTNTDTTKTSQKNENVTNTNESQENNNDRQNNNDTNDNNNEAKSKESTPISILTKVRKSGDHTPRADITNNTIINDTNSHNKNKNNKNNNNKDITNKDNKNDNNSNSNNNNTTDGKNKNKEKEKQKQKQKEKSSNKNNNNEKNNNNNTNTNTNNNNNDDTSSIASPTTANTTGVIELSEDALKKRHEKNKRAIFCQSTKMSRNVCRFLQLSQILTLQHVCLGSRKMADNFFRDAKRLDLSEYYGTIGSPEFDTLKFCREFLSKWKNVERLSLRYCSHLQASHLGRIITHLTPNPPEEGEKANNQVNMKLKELNLYFCSRLGANALLKIRNRLGALEVLNIGRCYLITANSNYNAFKQLVGSPIKSLTFSLDPSILKDEAMDVVSDLIHEQSFPNLESVDLSHGCQILNEVDLSDLQTRVKTLILPKKIKQIVNRSDS